MAIEQEKPMADEIDTGHSSGNRDNDMSISIDTFIFKVPGHLRSVNQSAYDPHIIAIGPYHRNNEDLSKYKMQSLKEFLTRSGEREEDEIKYLKALTEVEKDARAFYGEGAADVGSDDFLKIMLLDACFILELLRRFMDKLTTQIDDNANQERDTLLFSRSIIKKLRRDLLLFENQLPFCVLQKLFSFKTQQEQSLEELIICFFDFSSIPNGSLLRKFRSKYGDKKYKHLLSFIRDYWLLNCPEKKKKDNKEKHSRFMRCVTELKEAGIKFKKAQGGSLFDIKFENGIMKIPRLEITEETESIYRNVIVYEQYCPDENNSKSRRVISDYMKFMDCLVNSHKDVEVLCQCNILHNCLGNDEKVADMFNSIGDFGTLSPDNYYFDIFLKVNHYCDQKRHRWIAHLRHKYFNTPWAFVSFFAASLLLVLTLAQTVYSVLGYYKK